jgi:hypothetical protein
MDDKTNSASKFITGIGLVAMVSVISAAAETAPSLTAEIEEEVYPFVEADNGAGPMWCSGSTCLVRVGDRLFASGLESMPEAKPLNNCRWLLFERRSSGWVLAQADPSDLTREPCPLSVFPDGRVFLSVNPTLAKGKTGGGPARPEILEFSATDVKARFRRLVPVWEGKPEFTEHSYRSFSADGPKRELILFQNIGYTHAEWAFLDADGQWSARGQLRWPYGVEYPKPEPIRVCYPNVALNNRSVHFCGVSDIIEPYPEWRAYKRSLTGREWDYDFRRLFYTWTPDVTHTPFSEWVEISSRDKTCGWISPGDLWVAPDGAAHIVWSERALDERLREKFFPEAKQSHSIRYAIMRGGTIVHRRTLAEAEEGRSSEIPSSPRFHVTPDERLFVVYYVSGTTSAGKPISENRLVKLTGGEPSLPVRLALGKPFTSFFTATVRGGSPLSDNLEMLGLHAGESRTVSYAKILLR